MEYLSDNGLRQWNVEETDIILVILLPVVVGKENPTKVSNGVMHRVNFEKIFTLFYIKHILKEKKKA